MIYAPDPSAHTNPEIEKRCVYCHPEIKANREKERLEAERRKSMMQSGAFNYATDGPALPSLNSRQVAQLIEQTFDPDRKQSAAARQLVYSAYDRILGRVRR